MNKNTTESQIDELQIKHKDIEKRQEEALQNLLGSPSAENVKKWEPLIREELGVAYEILELKGESREAIEQTKLFMENPTKENQKSLQPFLEENNSKENQQSLEHERNHID